MEFKLRKPDAELVEELEKHAPAALQIIYDVTSELQQLLNLDDGTGLALSALRLAELARRIYSNTARRAEADLESSRKREYPDAFLENSAMHIKRLQVERLARQIIEKATTSQLGKGQEVRGLTLVHVAARSDYATWLPLWHAWDFLVHHVRPEFYHKLRVLVGEDRYRRLAYELNQAPVGAQGSYSSMKRYMGSEGSYRRARIYEL
ncbi:hypothetical protein JCM10296v2_007721 [Rhodotorula toruloides]